MITDRQWNIFRQHVKPNSTVRFGTLGEGYLLENFPYSQDNDRVDLENGLALYYGHDGHINEEGKFSIPCLELRVQLCESPGEDSFSPYEIDYWIRGEFLEFHQVIALGDVS